MTVAEYRAWLRDVERTLGMWTLQRTFPELYALIAGSLRAAPVGFISTFHEWLLQKTDCERRELAWPCLVSLHVYPGDAVAWRNATEADHEALNAALFAFLDEFLTTWVPTAGLP